MNQSILPKYLQKEDAKKYQQFLYKRFQKLIETKSIEFDKDKRGDIAKEIKEQIKQYGLGLAMLILHQQQIYTKHLLLEVNIKEKRDGKFVEVPIDLTQPTPTYEVDNKEYLLINVPIRKFRRNIDILKELKIINPNYNQKYAKRHKDLSTCFFCSCHQMNPLEVIISYDYNNEHLLNHYKRHLYSNYILGFTFTPFGRTDQVIHFLAWDNPGEDKWNLARNQNLRSHTIHDLVLLVCEINRSIKEFFKNEAPHITDYPQVDGAFNGWAGNTGWHEHYQFFYLENKFPIYNQKRTEILNDNKVKIERIDWPLCSLRISLSGFDTFDLDTLIRTATTIAEDWVDNNPARHTQNIIVHTEDDRPVIYHFARDITKVNAEDVWVKDEDFEDQSLSKHGFAVLESAGIIVIDEPETIKKLRKLSTSTRTEVVIQWMEQINPCWELSCPILGRLHTRCP